MRISIFDYGCGNLNSLRRAFFLLGAEVEYVSSSAQLAAASHIVLPGVGAFAPAMESLRSSGGIEALNWAAFERRIPILGICLGMQLLSQGSDEYNFHEGLGWIEGVARQPDLEKCPTLTLPHVGWAQVSAVNTEADDIDAFDQRIFYFDHSYSLPADTTATAAVCEYGQVFTAVLRSENIFGSQFHPELSGEDGQAFLRKFLSSSTERLEGRCLLKD